jgi:hypothetical protein
MFARRYRFRAHFGPDIAKPFEDLRRIHDEVINAARVMMVGSTLGGFGSAAFYEKTHQTLWSPKPKGDEPLPEDPISKRLDAAVAQIEQTCRPIIQEGVTGPR